MPSPLRFYGGWICFVLSWTLPLSSMAVPMLGLDKATTALVMGALIVGVPEVFMVLAAVLWGKETLAYFLVRAKGMLARLLPPMQVSPNRYRLGLVMFVLSSLPCWVLAYFPHWMDAPDRVRLLASADFTFVASFYVLGGNFFGKLRALFTPDPA